MGVVLANNTFKVKYYYSYLVQDEVLFSAVAFAASE